MKKVRVPLAEQETTINRYPKAYSEWSDFYSSDPVEIRRFKRHLELYPDDFKFEKEDEISIFGQVKTELCVSYRSPRKKKPPMTEEQKQALRERLKNNMKKTAE